MPVLLCFRSAATPNSRASVHLPASLRPFLLKHCLQLARKPEIALKRHIQVNDSKLVELVAAAFRCPKREGRAR